MDSTLHEELIIIPDSRGRRSTSNTSGDNKIRGKVSQLPSFSDIEADVVVVNTHFSSNGSNVVNFSTPEGGLKFFFIHMNKIWIYVISMCFYSWLVAQPDSCLIWQKHWCWTSSTNFSTRFFIHAMVFGPIVRKQKTSVLIIPQNS